MMVCGETDELLSDREGPDLSQELFSEIICDFLDAEL
jgi:hypothetical protein